MFVLKNAWSSIIRRKWRALLTVLIAAIVTFGTVFGVTAVTANNTATGSAYESQKVDAVIRPSAKTEATYNGADSSYTKNYLGWNGYTEYATQVQSAGVKFEYTFAITVPVRQSGDVKAIAGSDDQPADKTGGEFQWRAFYTLQGAQENEYGRYKIVEGKHLNYTGQTDKTSVLISQAVAKKNNLKVGDTFKVAMPNDAKKTIELKVRGIYEYTDAAAKGKGDDAKLAKDNRDNAIYSSYNTFGMNGLDAADGTGWLNPDLNITFILSDMKTYRQFQSALKKAKLPDTYTVSSPSLAAYEKRIAPLGSLAASMQGSLIALWIVGAILLLAAVGSSMAVGRRGEIGMQIMIGVSRPRISWQLMLEMLITVLPGFVIGLLAGAFGTKPLIAALAGGYAATPDAGLIWKTVWSGLGVIVALMILAVIRVMALRPATLFAARESNVAPVATTETAAAAAADADQSEAAAEAGSGKDSDNGDDTSKEQA